MIICPKCKGRATKLYNLNTGDYMCQQCEHKWTNEYGQKQRNDKIAEDNTQHNKGQEKCKYSSHQTI